MAIADRMTYLKSVIREMQKLWPDNRTVNIVFHGHSVPSGYFVTPEVRTFSAYPHLLHMDLKEIYPFAVINAIVTAIGGEKCLEGAKRFQDTVLCHLPDVLTIDYGLNDRCLDMQTAEKAWRYMIEEALTKDVKVLLLTPSWDFSYYSKNEEWEKLQAKAEQIRRLASEYSVGLADSFQAYGEYIEAGGDLWDLLSQGNHPNRRGHAIIAKELLKWFRPF